MLRGALRFKSCRVLSLIVQSEGEEAVKDGSVVLLG